MSSPASAFETKTSQDNLNKNSITVPMLFALEANEKTSYLLLTNHGICLSEFQKEVLQIINSCSFFVTEESDEDAETFYCKTIVKSSSAHNWIDDLPKDVVQFLEMAIDKSFDADHPSIRKKLHELKMWAALHFAIQGYISIILENNQANSDETDKTTIKGMDNTLVDIFANRHSGLQNFKSRIPQMKSECSSIQVFVDLFNEYQEYCDLNSKQKSHDFRKQENKDRKEQKNPQEQKSQAELKNQTNRNYQEAQEHENKFAIILNNYRRGYGLHSVQEATEANDDKETNERNILWLSNFIRFHNQEGTILFGVGASHGLGEWGLLSLLPMLGFRIKRFTPNNTFEDYTYPFHSEYISRLVLSQERLTTRWSRTLEMDAYSNVLFHQYRGKITDAQKPQFLENLVKASLSLS